MTKLCHIKCDHPVCVLTDGGHIEHIIIIIIQHLYSAMKSGDTDALEWWWRWHNFVAVGGNWIKICSPAYIEMLNSLCV